MSRIRRLSRLCAALVPLGGCAAPAPQGPVQGFRQAEVPPVPFHESRAAPRPIPALFSAPTGKGPFPAVIVLHGCGGRHAGPVAWGQRLNEWGYAALIPDSLTPRGLTTVCPPALQPMATPRDRVGDIAAAAAWLRGQPDIDPDRIAVLGQSHGGMTAALSVRAEYRDLRLRAAIDYYGRCGDPAAQGPTPLLALAGDADDWGTPAAGCRVFEQGKHPDAVFELHTYPGVYHGFDNKGGGPSYSEGHRMEYAPAAAEDSYQRVHAFLDRWVRPARAEAGGSPARGP